MLAQHVPRPQSRQAARPQTRMPKTGEDEDPVKTALRALECVEELFTLFLAACLSARLVLPALSCSSYPLSPLPIP